MKEIIGTAITVYLSYRFLCFLLDVWKVKAEAKVRRMQNNRRNNFIHPEILNNKN